MMQSGPESYGVPVVAFLKKEDTGINLVLQGQKGITCD